jgi:hypothetical protein
MARKTQLPRRIPVGTKYIIDGYNGHITARYLEFPDGRRLGLSTEVARPQPHIRVRRRIPHGRGTELALRCEWIEDRRVVVLRLIDLRRDRPHPQQLCRKWPEHISRIRLLAEPPW